ncbi:hypothetical protein [Actinoallomurus liliacearum]
MKATTPSIHSAGPEVTHHCGHGRDRTRRARRLAGDLLGSWSFLGVVLVVMAVALALIGSYGRGLSSAAALDVIMPGIALASFSLVLMAVHRADRTADLLAMRHLAAARRIEAAGKEIFSELNQINSGLARLTARVETIRFQCRVTAEAEQDEAERSGRS